MNRFGASAFCSSLPPGCPSSSSSSDSPKSCPLTPQATVFCCLLSSCFARSGKCSLRRNHINMDLIQHILFFQELNFLNFLSIFWSFSSNFFGHSPVISSHLKNILAGVYKFFFKRTNLTQNTLPIPKVWTLFLKCYPLNINSPVAQTVKYLSTMWETQIQSLGRKDPLEKEMATHSSTLAKKIPWMEEPGGLPSMGSQRVEHNS